MLTNPGLQREGGSGVTLSQGQDHPVDRGVGTKIELPVVSGVTEEMQTLLLRLATRPLEFSRSSVSCQCLSLTQKPEDKGAWDMSFSGVGPCGAEPSRGKALDDKYDYPHRLHQPP